MQLKFCYGPTDGRTDKAILGVGCCTYVQLGPKLQLCICVFVYLYLGNESASVGEWIVDVISFQKIFGLCCLKCHIVEIWRDVTFEDGQRTTDGRKCEYSARIREAGFAIMRVKKYIILVCNIYNYV